MIKITDNIEEANCITHSGNMHADDVFSTAFLELYLGDITVCRTSEVNREKLRKDAIVYDIGQGEFDHHQENPRKRENGITYCSFGLIWSRFGKTYLKEKNYENIDKLHFAIEKDLVEAIDGDDNGMFPKIEVPYKVKTLSEIIKLYNPSYKAHEDINEQFLKAVSFAKQVIIEEIFHINGKIQAEKKVLEGLTKARDHILILDEYLPYLETLLENDKEKQIYFIIFPSNREGYVIRTIPFSTEDSRVRVEFPKSWGGKTDNMLEEESGIKDLNFCHNKLFLASSKTKEAAVLAAKRAITAHKLVNKK